MGGLAQNLRSRRVQICERVNAQSISPAQVKTTQGDFKAKVIIQATEALQSSLKGQRRTILLLYSLMIATDPLPQVLWDDIGLRDRTIFNDGRTMINYSQKTADCRFAFGGRGAPYHIGSAIRSEFCTNSTVCGIPKHTPLELFPMLEGSKFTHHWGGPLGSALDRHSSVTFDSATGIATAGGYVSAAGMRGKIAVGSCRAKRAAVYQRRWPERTLGSKTALCSWHMRRSVGG